MTRQCDAEVLKEEEMEKKAVSKKKKIAHASTCLQALCGKHCTPVKAAVCTFTPVLYNRITICCHHVMTRLHDSWSCQKLQTAQTILSDCVNGFKWGEQHQRLYLDSVTNTAVRPWLLTEALEPSIRCGI